MPATGAGTHRRQFAKSVVTSTARPSSPLRATCRLTLAALAVLVVASACSGCSRVDDDTRAGGAASGVGATTEPAVPRGEALFAEHCSACHGPTGAGGVAPSLAGIADRLTLDAQLEVVRNGRGRMPAFAESIGDDDVASVVAYTREELPG